MDDVVPIDRSAREDAEFIIAKLRALADELEKSTDDRPTGFAVAVILKSGDYVMQCFGGSALQLLGSLEIMKHDLICLQPPAVAGEEPTEGA